jgi:hypothetical protein
MSDKELEVPPVVVAPVSIGNLTPQEIVESNTAPPEVLQDSPDKIIDQDLVSEHEGE